MRICFCRVLALTGMLSLISCGGIERDLPCTVEYIDGIVSFSSPYDPIDKRQLFEMVDSVVQAIDGRNLWEALSPADVDSLFSFLNWTVLGNTIENTWKGSLDNDLLGDDITVTCNIFASTISNCWPDTTVEKRDDLYRFSPPIHPDSAVIKLWMLPLRRRPNAEKDSVISTYAYFDISLEVQVKAGIFEQDKVGGAVIRKLLQEIVLMRSKPLPQATASNPRQYRVRLSKAFLEVMQSRALIPGVDY